MDRLAQRLAECELECLRLGKPSPWLWNAHLTVEAAAVEHLIAGSCLKKLGWVGSISSVELDEVYADFGCSVLCLRNGEATDTLGIHLPASWELALLSGHHNSSFAGSARL